jgi:phage/plasmid-like protein (TIGR03299 family)
MSHMIDESTGRAAFTFDATDGEAWHGLGVSIPEDKATDPRAIAELAGAGYSVYKACAEFIDTRGKRQSVPNRSVLVRDDTHEPLEVLSDNKYKIVQPVEYFEAFRDSLAVNNLRISSAGVLKGGRIVFVNAKFTDAGFDVLGVDRVNTYVCLGGGYDGTMSSFGYLSSLRTVCWNTLSANVAQRKREGGKLAKAGQGFFRVPHSAAFDGKVLGSALGLAGKELMVRSGVFNTLAGYKLQREAVAKFFCDVLKIDPVEQASGELSARTQNVLDQLATAYLTGPGADLPSANGTAWGALNAVTHYVDHLASTRDSYKDGTGAARFASAQFGTGADVKARALELAMASAGIAPELLQAA